MAKAKKSVSNKKPSAVKSKPEPAAAKQPATWRAKFSLPLMALAIALVSFAVFYAVGNNQSKKPIYSSNCEGTCVLLKSDGAEPREISVEAGSFVQFNSADGKSHNLSLGDDSQHGHNDGSFDSGEFAADEAWRVQFKKDGSYVFRDHLNPKISVLVVVYTPGKDYKIN